ncbi:HPr family phosphocarrier protein [Halorussus limi]|uniref:HPr family phosphocarrier protein n=1 Tax=Halorussus limi TaxID=2938695 RepID=A0A8U0HW22_9EURY|nr:HPr family phosphocarrier protein [Halorussus limi]UPV75118.1 HPr family phosphocarrier protein [Halorussus limi]
MTERRVTVARETGLHARPARAVADAAADFDADVAVEYDGETARAASPLELTALGVESGESVVVRARGDDADPAVEAVVDVLVGEADP